ncbi:hypothetical protein [Bradyrhizobium ottawaense]|uniref:hypothetical protein n=1 Tax=Bradyrhizobium ottawaense TaxID=931866 RepID=UPI0035120962
MMRDEIEILIDDEMRAALNDAGRLSLSEKQVKALRDELEEYALLREAELAVRSGPRKKQRLKIEKHTRKLLEDFSDLRSHLSSADPHDKIAAMNQEIMLTFAGINSHTFVRDLVRLQNYLEEVRTKEAPGGRPENIWWVPLLHSLADLYVKFGGRSTAVSRDIANEKKSVFIDFVWVAVQLFPQPLRPHSKESLASLWEKQKYATRAIPRRRKRM